MIYMGHIHIWFNHYILLRNHRMYSDCINLPSWINTLNYLMYYEINPLEENVK